MKKVLLTLVLSIFTIALFAQTFEVPTDCKLEKAEDYAKYEKDVLSCIDWLAQTPVNEQSAKRKEANAFLLKWLTGSPDVHIDIKPGIVTFMDSSPELLMIFMGGWAKYSIEKEEPKNNVAGSMAGIEAVISFYQSNKAYLKKSKEVEKYIKMKEKGKLEDYVKKNA